MRVDLLAKTVANPRLGTQDAEALVCVAARNDYKTTYVGEESFEEIIAPVKGECLNDKMVHLIHRLLRVGHFGPFEHVSFTFAAKGVSRVTMAQVRTHRLMSFDIQSYRYTSPDPAQILHIVESGEWGRMLKFVHVPQGVQEGGEAHIMEWLEKRAWQFVDYLEEVEYLEEDCGLPHKRAIEEARYALPSATKVNMVFTANARALMHLFDMRRAGDAQGEIQMLGDAVAEIFAKEMPITAQYYEENMKGRKNRLAP